MTEENKNSQDASASLDGEAFIPMMMMSRPVEPINLKSPSPGLKEGDLGPTRMIRVDAVFNYSGAIKEKTHKPD